MPFLGRRIRCSVCNSTEKVWDYCRQCEQHTCKYCRGLHYCPPSTDEEESDDEMEPADRVLLTENDLLDSGSLDPRLSH